MNFIFIYGPPAVGKTTVGRELARLTGYKFFYNHLTVPAAKALFSDDEPHHSKRYTELLQQLRLAGIRAAADAGLDVIFTMAYSGSVDDVFVAQAVEEYKSRGGKVHFVELHAPETTLLERVGGNERKAMYMGKMTSAKHLGEVLAARDMYASVKYPNIVKLDTSQLEPEEAARLIIKTGWS